MIRTSHAVAIAAFAVAVATTFATAQQSSGVVALSSRTSALAAQSLDVLPDGKAVITFVAAGDLAGVISVQLTPAGDGTYSGDWGFTVAHADATDPATGLEPEVNEHGEEHGHDGDEPAHPHRDFVRLVQQGTLSGTISGAQLTFRGDGALTELSAPLSLTQGSLEFDGATGSGLVTLDSLTLGF